MRKILISVGLAATLTGCGNIQIDKDSWDLFGDVLVNSLNKIPFVYRPLVVQGNVFTQEMVDELKPGMSRKQVEFALGTPLLKDIFHDNRWDYYYGIGIGEIELEKRIILQFNDEKLVRIVGDYSPQPEKQGEGKAEEAETVIIVPDWSPAQRTLVEKAMGAVGLEEDETTTKSQTKKK